MGSICFLRKLHRLIMFIYDATVRSVGGRVIKTYDEKLTKSGCNYTFNKSATLTYSGTYFMHYTLKCYKDGKIIDEITKNTAMDTYTA